MATKAPLSMYAETPEDQKIVQEYRDQQKMLMDSLINRKQLFDPTLLAIAQGLLSPTKTGSFGEALANAAGMAAPVMQQEEKRAQDIAKMRFDMAQQNFMLNRKDQAARMLAPPQAGAPAEAPAAGAPAGAPASGASAIPAAGGAGIPAVPKPAGLAQYSHITPELALQIGLRDPELGNQARQYIEAVNAQRKLAQEAVRFTDKGSFVVDPAKPGGGTFTPAPGRALVSRFLPGTGNVDLTEQDAEKFDNVRDVLSNTPDDPAAQRELSRLVSKYRGAPKAGTPGPMTPAEAELDKKQRELTSELRTKSDATRYEDMINKGSLAASQIPRYRQLYSVVTGPNANQYLGIFRGPKFAEAIGLLVEGKAPNIREAFTNVGLDKEIKAEQLAVAQQVGLINSEMRKILRAPGEGAQSDMENRMALAVGIEMTDPAQGMAKKIKFLETKAEFEKEVARELSKSNMSATEFVLTSNKYQDLLQNYERKLGQVLGLTPQQTRSSAPKAGGNYSAAGDALDKKLGLKP
jgi:hypothetical protein